MAVTLTVEELMLDVIDAFKHRMPALQRMGTDFRPTGLKLDQTYKARIVGVPGVSDYDENNGGYQNQATDARSLLTDVPITVDNHKKVSLSWSHLDSIKDQIQQYQQVVGNAGYALAKHVTLDIAAKITAANLSEVSTHAVADSDYDVINAIRNAMNLKAADADQRFGIVNTDVASVLGLDDRVISGDYRGDMANADRTYRVFKNIAGFSEIFEFPLLPDNGQNLTGIFFEPRALAVLAGIPDDFDTFAVDVLGAPKPYKDFTVTDPDTGLTMVGIAEIQGGTLKGFLHLTLVWGTAVGKQGGAAGDLTDYAGHRLVSA